MKALWSPGRAFSLGRLQDRSTFYRGVSVVSLLHSCRGPADGPSDPRAKAINGRDDRGFHDRPVVDDQGVVETQGFVPQRGCRRIA